VPPENLEAPLEFHIALFAIEMCRGHGIEVPLTWKKLGGDLGSFELPASCLVHRKAAFGPWLKGFCKLKYRKLALQSIHTKTHFPLLKVVLNCVY
jgi:hypothetical protein